MTKGRRGCKAGKCNCSEQKTKYLDYSPPPVTFSTQDGTVAQTGKSPFAGEIPRADSNGSLEHFLLAGLTTF